MGNYLENQIQDELTGLSFILNPATVNRNIYLESKETFEIGNKHTYILCKQVQLSSTHISVEFMISDVYKDICPVWIEAKSLIYGTHNIYLIIDKDTARILWRDLISKGYS
jgi:hypothetical protein